MAKSLRRIALVVAVATALSKLAGLVRQQAIAAAFGVGVAYDAYNYAYVLPGFLLILLGGINGPFHSAMVSVLARRPRQEGAYVLAAINTLVGAGLLGVTVLLLVFAGPLITLVGPGLDATRHDIAVLQLRWMAPMALFAGLIGLGFGALNAADEFWLPSVSPLLSSVAVIAGIAVLWWQLGAAITLPTTAVLGGVVLAGSTTLGAVLQWLIQLPALARQGLQRFQLVWDWRDPGVREVLQVMGPATLSSGMLQINVFVSLFFASGIPAAAAGLGYANLLVQTPLGLLSNALLVPLLPVYARLTAPDDRPELIGRIRQGLMLSNASMLPLGALMVALALPIVALIYERGAFNAGAAELVGNLLMAYGIGMPAYLARDVLVRVFYALGDGVTPFPLVAGGDWAECNLLLGFRGRTSARPGPAAAWALLRRRRPGAGHRGGESDHLCWFAAGTADQARRAATAAVAARHDAAVWCSRTGRTGGLGRVGNCGLAHWSLGPAAGVQLCRRSGCLDLWRGGEPCQGARGQGPNRPVARSLASHWCEALRVEANVPFSSNLYWNL